jgi:uncharacterized metal-binding protein YceD (DUF177 family)
MSKKNLSAPELSRPVAVESLAAGSETAFEIHTNAEERAALAKRFDLLALENLTAAVTVVRSEDGIVRLSGRLKAEVVQTCVVTLDPVRSTIETEFSRSFSEAAVVEEQEEVFLTPEDEDPPEPLEGGRLDAGEVVAESLGLALNPFPRAPGAALPLVTGIPPENGNTPDKSGPFAVLAKLKKQR